MSARYTKYHIPYTSAFTLIEIIIVITLIAILAILVISGIISQINKANDAKRKADLDRIRIAVEEFEKDHNCYPPYINCGVDKNQPIYPYLNDVPCDPVTHKSYGYDIDPNAKVCPDWYRLFADLQSGGGTAVGLGGNYNYYIGSVGAPPGQLVPVSGRYGCKNGVCVPISWNTVRPGPECDPNYLDSNCNNHCGSGFECNNWTP